MSLHSQIGFLVTFLGLILSTGLGGCSQVSPTASESSPTSDSSQVPEHLAQEPLASNVSVSSSAEENPIRVGVLTIDSALSVHERYDPLVGHLSKTLEQPFELVPLDQESQFSAVAQGEIDFIINNPLAAVQIQRLYNTEFLVTHSRPLSGTQFSALVIVRSDSSIQTLEDLQGKRVACVDFETAAAGCLFQVYHLIQNNIDPFQDFDTFIENPSQDNIVLAVLNGTLDAGFIRTGQLEKMLKNDLLPNLDDIRVLEPIDDTFVYAHTTALYPEWPIAALSDTDPALSNAVQSALLALSDDHSALIAANIDGFVESVDYQLIHDLIETLKLKSWDAD